MKCFNRLCLNLKKYAQGAQYLFSAFFILFLIILQTTCIHKIEIFHTVPNLIFVFCVIYSVKNGGLSAVIFSVAAGLLSDMLNGMFRVSDALLYLYISLGCVFIHDRFYVGALRISMLCVLCAAFLYGTAFFGINFLLRGETKLGYALGHRIIPEAIYNFIVSPIVYPFVCKCGADNYLSEDDYRE